MTTTNLITELGTFQVQEVRAAAPAEYRITIKEQPHLTAAMRWMNGAWRFTDAPAPEPFRSAEKMLAGLIAVEREGLN